jgi:hypothetical protein
MFSIEGYESIRAFKSAAFRAIYGPVSRERWRRWEEQKASGEERTQYPWANYNSELAAEYIVFDLFSKMTAEGKQKPKILRPEGGMIDVPVSILRPTFYPPQRDSSFWDAREKAFEDKKIDRSDDDEKVFGIRSLSMRYWVVPFLTEERVFYQPELKVTMDPTRMEKYIPIINWHTGLIDLTQLKAYLEILELSRQYIVVAKRGAFTLPASMEKSSLYPPYYTPHKSLMPFDGCSIVAPAEWLDQLNIDKGKNLGGESFMEDCTPTEKILKLWDEGMKRDDIYPIIAETYGVSPTKAKTLWKYAAVEYPQISRSGPRNSRSGAKN